MNFKKYKPTFISVLSIIGIMIGIPFGLYCMTLKGGASIGAVLVFGVVIGLIVLLAIDRLFISHINPKKLSLIEIILFIISFLLYLVTQD